MPGKTAGTNRSTDFALAMPAIMYYYLMTELFSQVVVISVKVI
jgi:hypothetical protein